MGGRVVSGTTLRHVTYSPPWPLPTVSPELVRAISLVQTPPPPTVAGTGSIRPGSAGSVGSTGGTVDTCTVSSGVEEVSNRKLFVGGANLRGCGRFDLCPDMKSIRQRSVVGEGSASVWRGFGV